MCTRQHLSGLSAKPQRVTESCLSLRCAGGSNKLQLFVKEQERNKLLCSSEPQLPGSLPSAAASGSAAEDACKTPASRGRRRPGKKGRTKDVEEDPSTLGGAVDQGDESLDKGKTGRKSGARRKPSEQESVDEPPPENPVTQPAPGESRYSHSFIFNNLHTVFFPSAQMKPQTAAHLPPLRLSRLVITLLTPV